MNSMDQIVKVKKLMSRGVNIANSVSVEVGSEVNIENISSDGVTIHSGCRIFGKSTVISPGVVLGSEGPVTLKDCRLGCNVELKGGYFDNSIFMDGVSVGPNCHIRPGSILEESVSVAHSVGLKQTILFPFVKLGSLINFCDCFMSGGTSDVNHSEVGSSYIHFNYTPNKDKATPSLIGDVAHGVMLNQNPIFLGGQGGLVGPCRIAYGTVIASGSIQREDQLKPNRLIISNNVRKGNVKYMQGVYLSVARQALNNIVYVANLLALMCWYRNIRKLFVADGFSMLLFEGLLEALEVVIKNRVGKFEMFCCNLKESLKLSKSLLGADTSSLFIQQKKELYENRKVMNNIVSEILDKIRAGSWASNSFVYHITQQIDQHGYGYLDTIKNLESDSAKSGTLWLQGIVDKVINTTLSSFQSINIAK